MRALAVALCLWAGGGLAGAPAEVERARAEVRKDRLEVERLTAELEQARARLSGAEVRLQELELTPAQRKERDERHQWDEMHNPKPVTGASKPG